MYMINQRILGIIIVILLGMLVVTKQVATGSILDKPRGKFLVQLVNIFNLFFLLIVNPLVAILLITRQYATADLTRISIANAGVFTTLAILGMIFYVAGFLLMVWALISLRRNYQLGGSTPRATDMLVILGPYRILRHPMYAAALYISLGLTLLTQSLACLAVFCIYLVLILLLIPMEEQGLQGAYGSQYIAYQQKVRKLVPFVF